jgi:hypothetical protein
MAAKGEISIWLFIGVSLLVNGVVIFGAGIYEYIYPPVEKVVLFDMHAGIWWGAILAVVGAIYCICFAPGKGRV